jgi:hypothetical protein
MGFLRKTISGTLGLATGGLSLPFVQFRSDTERGTRQTKLLRDDARRQHYAELAVLNDQLAVEQNQADALAGIRAQQERAVTPRQTVGALKENSSFDQLGDKALASGTQDGSVADQLDNYDLLETASELWNLGYLTKEEFETEKQKLLR